MKHCETCQRKTVIRHMIRLGQFDGSRVYWVCRNCLDEIKTMIDVLVRVTSRG